MRFTCGVFVGANAALCALAIAQGNFTVATLNGVGMALGSAVAAYAMVKKSRPTVRLTNAG